MRWTIWVGIVVLVLVAVGALVAPPIAGKYLKQAIESGCTPCSLEYRKIRLGYFPPSVEFGDVKFMHGAPGKAQVQAIIRKATVKMGTLERSKKVFEIAEVAFEEPRVIVMESGIPVPTALQPTPSLPAPEKKPAEWTFIVQRVVVTNGHFTYERKFPKKNAVIQVAEVDGKISSFGNAPSHINQIAWAEARARLENTGTVYLKVGTPWFQESLHVELDLELNEQDLAELNPYFRVSDGMEMRGFLHAGKSRAEIKDKKLESWVKAEFREFGLKFNATQERSEVAAFFSNLGAAIQLKKTNVEERPKEKLRGVQLQRKADESVIELILRGMKESAMKVVGG